MWDGVETVGPYGGGLRFFPPEYVRKAFFVHLCEIFPDKTMDHYCFYLGNHDLMLRFLFFHKASLQLDFDSLVERIVGTYVGERAGTLNIGRFVYEEIVTVETFIRGFRLIRPS